MPWSPDNPIVGEFEDLIPQPLPYRTVFVPAEPPSAALTVTDANVSLPTRWSPDNPVVGEFEDLIPQPLPYRTTFVVADQPAESVSLSTADPIDTVPPSDVISTIDTAPPHAIGLLSPFSGHLVPVADGFQPSADADDELTLPYLISSIPVLSGDPHQPSTRSKMIPSAPANRIIIRPFTLREKR